MRVAVLVSGTGRHLKNLLMLERSGRLPIEVALVISSREGVAANDHARHFGVLVRVLKTGEVTAALDEHAIDLVVMAGYLRKWPIPEHYVGKTINIHPSLLPLFGGQGFFGDHVHRAVLESGMRVSGCTVHFVTQNYDEGPIIAQRAVPVHADDTVDHVAHRVFAAEAELLPSVVAGIASGRIRFHGPSSA